MPTISMSNSFTVVGGGERVLTCGAAQHRLDTLFNDGERSVVSLKPDGPTYRKAAGPFSSCTAGRDVDRLNMRLLFARSCI